MHEKPDIIVDIYRREAELKFELWTTGEFTADALALLHQQQRLRTKNPIDWKTGADLMAYAIEKREKAIADVLKQHFLKHPLARVNASTQV